MTIEQMRQRKRELGYSYQKIAKLSGLPVGTVQKVLGGITRSPREETIGALETVLNFAVKMEEAEDNRDVLTAFCRVERIDGTEYPLETPSVNHQLWIGEILSQIRWQMKQNHLEGMVMVSPVNVRLCEDTLVQPDLMVICDPTKIQKDMVWGAPDLIVEVLSCGTRRKDMSIKLAKYAEAGVREYWMVDPEKKRILVYPLEQEELPMMYGCEDQVVTGIFHGKMCLDFGRIYEYLRG